MESLRLWGTIVNTLTVVLGSCLGLMIKILAGKVSGKLMSKGSEIGARLSDVLMNGIALCSLVIGISGAIKTKNALIMIISIAVGGIIGELLNLDAGINLLGNKLEERVKGKHGRIAEGFVSASLLFCVGAMTIVGSLNSGISADHQMLYTKSVLDLVSSTVLAASLGIGVLFSSVFVFTFQGAITLLAQWIAPFLADSVITEMTAVGSLLIIGLGLNLLKMTNIKVMNYLPAMFMPILLCQLF